jgi:hypothetical protein
MGERGSLKQVEMDVFDGKLVRCCDRERINAGIVEIQWYKKAKNVSLCVLSRLRMRC